MPKRENVEILKEIALSNLSKTKEDLLSDLTKSEHDLTKNIVKSFNNRHKIGAIATTATLAGFAIYLHNRKQKFEANSPELAEIIYSTERPTPGQTKAVSKAIELITSHPSGKKIAKHNTKRSRFAKHVLGLVSKEKTLDHTLLVDDSTVLWVKDVYHRRHGLASTLPLIEGKNCINIENPDIFMETSSSAIEASKTICTDCPAKDACLARSLLTNEMGVWGGTSEEDRKAIFEN